MANREEKRVIEPSSVDISGFDLVVFCSLVWAIKSKPVIHAAIDGLKGSMGKPAVAFSTHGGRPGQTNNIFKKWIEERGMVNVAITNIHQTDRENQKRTKELVALFQASIKV
jgi:hypothetical protein